MSSITLQTSARPSLFESANEPETFLRDLKSYSVIYTRSNAVALQSHGQFWHGVCPRCRWQLRWRNWSRLNEVLLAECVACGSYWSSIDVPIIKAELGTVHGVVLLPAKER